MKVCLSTIALFSWLHTATAGVQPRTQVCNFDGNNATKVYKVVTAPGVGTTFRLPEGLKITDFVVADPKDFHGESNGTIGIVTPLVPNKSTSVSIYTENDKLFVFNLSSDPDPAGYVDQLVVVECTNLQFFNQKVQAEAQKVAKDQLEAAEASCNTSLEEKARQTKEHLLFSINSNYEIKDRYFSVTKVSDDGVFTYIQLAKSQERPVVYFGESNDQKKLEPVKYTDEGGYYIVHRVLPPGEKRFFLKLGNQISEVRRSR
ncbi:MAG TPA: TrbG/VirB9 family P-type conjugative transfer protein [Acidobacteriota bacterium]|nr:TrbG/VirB9 family P-type conjugative transfer protein [Acidobacteriota bacterium]